MDDPSTSTKTLESQTAAGIKCCSLNKDEERKELERATISNSADIKPSKGADNITMDAPSADTNTLVSQTDATPHELATTKENGLQATEVVKPAAAKAKKLKRKAPPPPRPPLPDQHSSAPPSSNKKCDPDEVKSMSMQGLENNKEQPSHDVVASTPPSRKGKNKVNEAKSYPGEINPLADCSHKHSSAPVPLSSNKKCDSDEVKSLSIQGLENNKEQPSDGVVTPTLPSREGKNKGNEATSYPGGINPLADCSYKHSRAPVPPSSNKKCDSDEVKSLSMQGLENNKEQPSDGVVAPTPPSRKGKNKGNEAKSYPGEINPLADCSHKHSSAPVPPSSNKKCDSDEVNSFSIQGLENNKEQSPHSVDAEEIKPFAACANEDELSAETQRKGTKVRGDQQNIPVPVPSSAEKVKKVRRKAPPPPPLMPPKQSDQHTSTSVPSSTERKSDSNEVTSLSQPSNSVDSPSPPSRKRKKKKKTAKYPRELNPFGDNSSEDELSTESRGKDAEDPRNIPSSVPSLKSVDTPSPCSPKGTRKKKTTKYPRELNPFGDNSSEDELSTESRGKDAEDPRNIPSAVPSTKSVDTPSPSSPKGKTKKKTTKYPRELNPFGASSSEDELSIETSGKEATIAENSLKIPATKALSSEKTTALNWETVYRFVPECVEPEKQKISGFKGETETFETFVIIPPSCVAYKLKGKHRATKTT